MRVSERDQIRRLRNMNYEKDIRYVVKHSKWILSSIGVWPPVVRGAKRYLPNVAIGLSNSVLLFAIVPCILHIVYEEKNIATRLKLFGLLSFCVICLGKYWALTARKPRIKDCIEYVKDDWKQVETQGDRELMLKYGKIGRDLTITCAAFMYTSGAIYHTVLQYAFGNIVNEQNRTIKRLVYPTYSALYDVQPSPVYESVYIVHCLCGYVIYSVTTGACGLAALFATHVCGQIDILVSRLQDLVDHERNSDPTVRLTEIVQRHLRTLRFSATVETILQEVCFLEFVGSTLMICLLEYQCITAWEENDAISVATYTMLLVSLTFNIFILCYIGQLLIEKTTAVGLSCFMIDWYRLPTKTIQGLILVIGISNNPCKISAGGIVDLNFSTFGNVLKTSLAYVSFIRTAMSTDRLST